MTALPIRLLAVSAAERHDRFKMKLDRGDRQRFMFNRHDHTVRRSRCHPQTDMKTVFTGKLGMVAAYGDVVRKSGEQK